MTNFIFGVFVGYAICRLLQDVKDWHDEQSGEREPFKGKEE